MHRAVLALVLFLLSLQSNASLGWAQANDEGSLCPSGQVPIIDVLYFASGVVAPSGCYPIATMSDMSSLESIRRGPWPSGQRPDQICRPAYPQVDIRDDVRANATACALPTRVVVTWANVEEGIAGLMSDLTDQVVSMVGAHSYGGPLANPALSAAGALARPSTPSATTPRPLGAAGGGRLDYDCADFATWGSAQAFFILAGGPTIDPNRLDADRDGTACEHLPGALVTAGPRGDGVSVGGGGGGSGGGGCGSRGGPGGARTRSGRCPSR
jgi:hypothetical protein